MLMSFIDWQDDFLTGVKDCDLQHRKIFNMINALYDGIRFNIEKKTLRNSLETLRRYIELHFRTEEEILERYGYPETEAHIAEHKRFTENFGKLLNQEDVNFLEVLKFLKNWWISHLLNQDRRYGWYLREK